MGSDSNRRLGMSLRSCSSEGIEGVELEKDARRKRSFEGYGVSIEIIGREGRQITLHFIHPTIATFQFFIGSKARLKNRLRREGGFRFGLLIR